MGKAKTRGTRRRLNRLRRWAEGFAGNFPSRDIATHSHWNRKIPVHSGLAEGEKARHSTIVECVRSLIAATDRLVASKPEWARGFRVTCCISVPDAFASEICIYMDEGYFQRQISPANDRHGIKKRIRDYSLSKRWNLVLPDGFHEVGVRVVKPDDEHGDYRSDWWFFGEVES